MTEIIDSVIDEIVCEVESEFKHCNKCDLTQSKSEFSKNKNSKDGLSNQCKGCVAKYGKIYRQKNKEAIAKKNSIYVQNNKQLVAERSARYYQKNKEAIKKKCSIYKQENREAIADSRSRYRKRNKEAIAQYHASYFQKNKQAIYAQRAIYRQTAIYIKKNKRAISRRMAIYRKKNKRAINKQSAAYRKNRRHTDKGYRIEHNLRTRMSKAMNRTKKSASTMKLTGLESGTQMKEYLELVNPELKDVKCDIDHRLPCSMYDLTLPEQQKACFHYTNLQWLIPEVNQFKKGAKYPPDLKSELDNRNKFKKEAPTLQKQLSLISHIESHNLTFKQVVELQRAGNLYEVIGCNI